MITEEKTLGYKTYVAEVQSMWAGNCYPEVVDRLRGFRLTGKKAKSRDNRVPNYGDDVLNKIFQRGSIGDNQPKFLFKRNLFLDHDPGVAETTRNRELAVVYSQVQTSNASANWSLSGSPKNESQTLYFVWFQHKEDKL